MSALLKNIALMVPQIRRVHASNADLRSQNDALHKEKRLLESRLLAQDKVLATQGQKVSALYAAAEIGYPLCRLHGPRVTNRGLMMAVHQQPDISISECIRRFGIWEPTETDYLIDHLGEGDTFIDIGANIGYHSVLAASLVGDRGRVFSFEPDTDNFALLSLNMALNSFEHVRAINSAVSDADGNTNLHKSPDNMGDHRLWDHADWGHPGTPTTVRMTKLSPDMIGKKTLVKIDVQGWEAKVILGNIDVIMRADRIAFEFLPRWVEANGDDPRLIVDAFSSHGFTFRQIVDEERRLVPRDSEWIKSSIPALISAKDTPDDLPYIDLVAERPVAGH